MSDESLSLSEGVQNAFDMYGRIKEGVHVAGYSFERACSHLEWLLDEGRWKLGGRFDNVNKFLESIKLDQFRVVTEERQRIAKRIKELQPAATNVAIANTLGVSESAVRLDLGKKKQPSDKSEPDADQCTPEAHSSSIESDKSAPVDEKPAPIVPSEPTTAANAAPAEEEPAPAVPSQPADATNVAPPEPTQPPPKAAGLGGADVAKAATKNAEKIVRGTEGTGENEWYTPPDYIEMARAVLGTIELDPATSEQANEVVKAGQIFTLADDGLNQEWRGNVWMNPPYAQPYIQQFIEKLVAEYQAGRVTEAIALTHNYTDTRWFQHAAGACRAICFTRGRIGFLKPTGEKAAPTQGQAFFYFGDDPQRFADEFADVGFVVETLTGQEGGNELL